MSSGNSALDAAGWGVVLVGTGAITGTVVDVLVRKVLQKHIQQPVVRGLVQVGVGVVVLGQMMQAIFTAGSRSPIGDGPLVFFFFLSQPGLIQDVHQIGAWIRRTINGYSAQPITGPLTPLAAPSAAPCASAPACAAAAAAAPLSLADAVAPPARAWSKRR